MDVVFVGDYQPTERKFEVSGRMLEVCLDLASPVSILSRSPLVLRNLNLVQAINQEAVAVVMLSIISTPDSPYYERVKKMENLIQLQNFAYPCDLEREIARFVGHYDDK